MVQEGQGAKSCKSAIGRRQSALLATTIEHFGMPQTNLMERERRAMQHLRTDRRRQVVLHLRRPRHAGRLDKLGLFQHDSWRMQLKDSQGTCHALPAKTQALHSSRQQSHPVTKLDHQLFQIRVFSSTTEARQGRDIVQSRRRCHKKWQTVELISKQHRCSIGILQNKHRYNTKN